MIAVGGKGIKMPETVIAAALWWIILMWMCDV